MQYLQHSGSYLDGQKLVVLKLPSVQSALAVSFRKPFLHIQLKKLVEIITDDCLGYVYLRINVARDCRPDKRRRMLPAKWRSRIFHKGGTWYLMDPYGSLNHVNGKSRKYTIFDGFPLL